MTDFWVVWFFGLSLFGLVGLDLQALLGLGDNPFHHGYRFLLRGF